MVQISLSHMNFMLVILNTSEKYKRFLRGIVGSINSTVGQQLQSTNKEDIQVPHYWNFVRGTTGGRGIPLTKDHQIG